MVALRGNNNSNNLSHGCISHGNQSQQRAMDVSQNLQTSMNMPQSSQHMNANQINLQSINNVSLQFIPQQTNANSHKHEQSSSRYTTNSNCVLPSHHYRVLSQSRPVECYHPSGASGATYMPSTSGGSQSSAPSSLRVQPTPQPSAPPAPQQDMSKTTMSGHNYVPQNQSGQQRPQYQNYQYRAAQHNSRPSTHPRQQQQPFIPGAAAPTGTVMYPLVFQPTHVSLQTYQQPRSNTPYHYPYVGYIQSFNSPPAPTPQYFYPSSSPQLPTQNPAGNAQGRSNPTTLVGPQGTPATATAPTATIPHPQAPTHMHQPMPGIRPVVQKRTSHRLPIINPETNQEVLPDPVSNDSYVTSDISDRHTPQPEPTHSVAEEFNRRVIEIANQPCDSVTKSNYVSKNVELPVASTLSSIQPQPNAITSVNHNHTNKSDMINLNESKALGLDVVVEHTETPIVSAISDSPVIVPKMPISIKQLQKNTEPAVQSLVVDTNKNIQPNKQHKSKNVPHNDDLEKPSDNISINMTGSSAMGNLVSSAPMAIIAPTFANVPANMQVPALSANAPQPQRIREGRERVKSEEKDKKDMDSAPEKEIPPTSNKPNGPTSLPISSVDSLDAINPPTSQNIQATSTESKKNLIATKQPSPAPESKLIAPAEPKVVASKGEPRESHLTATKLLSASIEKHVKEKPLHETKFDVKETSSAIEAQVKLTQSLSSVLRNNQAESKMKDTNLNNKTTDPDTANGNPTELNKSETVKEDINKNEKVVKNTKNSNKKSNKMASNDVHVKETESYENGNETDKVVNVELQKNVQEETGSKQAAVENAEANRAQPVFVPKYKYSDDQWSPLNKSGRKCYDIDLLMQIKDDPLSKNKPDAPLLEACNVIRTAPLQETIFANISRPVNDSLFPTFLKNSGMGTRNNAPRDMKKDGRNMTPSGRGSMKMASTPSNSSSHKPLISIILRDDVKLNEVDSAWKPNRFRQENLTEEEQKTQELYKKFRGILNKLTPQKFDTLLDRVKTLEINNQKRLEGVIDLVFEKAIDEPNFSEAYAAMCNKLSKLKVPADNPTQPDQCVNFRALIINKCQNQFVTDKVDEQVLKIEKDIAECTDPVKKKELQLMLEEEHRRVRRRSVGNVRFIGELYKLKMLTSKIMDYCMKYLIDKLDEEKLECLCKLLTTIGEQIENEVNGQLDIIFKKMQDIVDKKSNKISSRVKFMIQDVILLRRRKWVAKSVVDSQPKMMDQIQKEAEQHQRQIELINANPMGGRDFRRDEGGRGKRGDSRRQNSSNSYMDNTWKSSRANFPVDTSKLKVGSQKISTIKLAPQTTAWTQGSGTKNTSAQLAGSNSTISVSKNMYSMLENVQTDPTMLRGTRDMTPSYHSKGASIERSIFNSRGDMMGSGGSRSGSVGVARSNSGTRSTSAALPAPVAPTETHAAQPAVIPQEPLTDAKKKSVKSMIELCLINPDDDEMVAEIKQLFPPQYHASVVSEIINLVLEKSAKDIAMVVKSLLYLVSTNTISADNFLAGMKEIFEFAPDLYIDIPMLYDNLGKFVAPHIEKKHITLVQVFALCANVVSSNQGHLFLRALFREMKDSLGPTFVKNKWQESGLQLKQWMEEEQIAKWIEDNKFEFLEGGGIKSSDEVKEILTPAETQAKLLHSMNLDLNCDCIKGWVQDRIGKASNEDWFMRALIQAICEHALFGPEGRDVPHFNQDRMNKYASLIHEFGETKESREANCLFGIQQLIHRLEHPQGITLEIFQFLHEQYIISLDGFISWEKSEKEPEGKGVLMKTLTSFFTNIKEADNEDSSED